MVPLKAQPVDSSTNGCTRCEPIPANELPSGHEVITAAGRGTFCDVWQIRNQKSNVRFAYKRLRNEWRDNAAARRLLANESQVAQAVNSRNVICAETGQAATAHGVLLEWLDGQSLEQRLQVDGTIPIAEAVWVSRQCAQGLLALEQAGYSHGDLKPSNIYLVAGGEVKLVDLGFARPVGPRLNEASSRMITGTPEYMAPESLSRQASSPVAKDVYSLGVTLFRMLTGELPFVADSTAEVLQMQRTSRPPLLRRKCPLVPSELALLVGQMLAKQPIRRPNNLRTLVRTLIEFELSLFPQRAAG